MARKKTFAELMAEAALAGMPEDKTTADLLNVPLSRGAILPLTEYLDRAEFDLSSGLPGAFADAVTAPARAARGEISEDQQIHEAFNFAGSLTLGSLLAPRPTGSVGMGGRAAKLDMSEAARMARAKEMGFDTENVLYHGSPYANLIKEFDMASPSRTDSGWLGTAAYMSPKEFVAKAYATPMNGKSSSYPDRGVLKLYAKKGKYKDFEYLDTETYQGQIKEFAKSLGVDGEFGTKQWSDAFRQAMIDNGYVGSRGLNADGSIVETAIYDPSHIRSVNAAFDPEKAHLANLLAANAKTGAAVPLATKALEAQQPQGIRAFHGSPHDFDRFSMEHIGKGEGAQAYGHGLYFAEAEDVARSYRDALAADNMKVAGNKIVPRNYAINTIVQKYRDDLPLLEEKLRTYAADETNNPYAYTEDAISIADSIKRGDFSGDVPGHMYEVNINADPQSFIDYDIPLGQQSEAVRRALDEAGLMPYTVVDQAGNRLDFSKGMPKAEAERFAAVKGGRAIPKEDADFDAVRKAQMMTGRGDAAQADIAAALREAGVPGIKYLDQMSRGEGKGSSNYVVFDDKIIDIVRKYGIAGLALLQAAGYGANEGEETQ